jgi:hypothetical protein
LTACAFAALLFFPAAEASVSKAAAAGFAVARGLPAGFSAAPVPDRAEIVSARPFALSQNAPPAARFAQNGLRFGGFPLVVYNICILQIIGYIVFLLKILHAADGSK